MLVLEIQKQTPKVHGVGTKEVSLLCNSSEQAFDVGIDRGRVNSASCSPLRIQADRISVASVLDFQGHSGLCSASRKENMKDGTGMLSDPNLDVELIPSISISNSLK